MSKKGPKIKHGGDYWIVILTLALSLFGIVAVYSASYYAALSKTGESSTYLKDDIVFVILGWVAFLFLANFDYHLLKIAAVPAIAFGLLLLALIYTPLGVTINNATRWLDFKIFTVMPGEVIKTCLILYLAWFYDRKEDNIRTAGGIVKVLALAGICFVAIWKQPNLSTAGTVVILIACIMFAAGLDWKIVFAVGILGLFVLAVVLLAPSDSYQLGRVTTFLDPFKDPLGDGYQVIQGLLAFGSGGILGKGIGKSLQKNLYLPEPQSDFILPIIGEEIGLLGVLILLAVYLFLIWRCFSVCIKSRDRYGMLLGAGISIHLALHVVLNVAVVTASFPPTGVVLPFVSLGGNATVLFIAEMGIMYNISKNTHEYRLEMPLEEE